MKRKKEKKNKHNIMQATINRIKKNNILSAVRKHILVFFFKCNKRDLGKKKEKTNKQKKSTKKGLE